MLLRGLSMLILFQLLGTAINVLFLPMLPGPILGFVLMFVYLLLRGGVSENINLASSSLLKYLPLLLTPPAVGIMAHTDAVMADFWLIGDFGTGFCSGYWLIDAVFDPSPTTKTGAIP